MEKIMNRYQELKDLVDGLAGDFEKFYDKGNSAAGTRIRKQLQAVGAFAKEVRKDVTEVKNARKADKS